MFGACVALRRFYGLVVITPARDTFENLQSEFWQLAFQFALLAGFFEFVRVNAYEEDEEDVKQRLERIERLLTERR